MEAKLLSAERFCDLKTGVSYRYVISDTEYFRPHFHEYYEIFLMQSGSATHFVNERKISLKEGDLVFVRPDDVHDYLKEKGQFSLLNITITKQVISSLFDYLGDGFPAKRLVFAKLPPTVSLSGSDFEWFNSRMESIRALDINDVEKIGTFIKVFILRIMTRFFSNFDSEESLVPHWLEALCEKMKESDNFIEGADRMFSLSGKSREHICRCMKKYYGITVTEFINDLRLNFVANMLVNSNYRIIDIIYGSGFDNVSWASRLFKQKYSTSMSEYRKAFVSE